MLLNSFKSPRSRFFLIFGLVALVLVVYGYSRAMPPEDGGGDTTQPRIVVDPEVWDFGEVEFEKIVEHSFEVRNTGDETLEIKRVSTSCGCTKASVDQESIAPGESTQLRVAYDSGAMGRQIIGQEVERFVYIRSNDPKNPQVEVIIYARVR